LLFFLESNNLNVKNQVIFVFFRNASVFNLETRFLGEIWFIRYRLMPSLSLKNSQITTAIGGGFRFALKRWLDLKIVSSVK